MRRFRPFAALLVLALALPGQAGERRVGGHTPARALVLGQRMYREGLLPSGKPMEAVVSGDVPVPGTAFTCVSCHLRSGVGSWEGGVVTLSTHQAKLAQPRYWKFPNLTPEEREELQLKMEPARPAYTDEALARAIRSGMDPGGRELLYAMPRYHLSEPDMAVLVYYLRHLSARPSPGADARRIRVATVIAGAVPAEDEAAMLVPMRNFIARHNPMPEGFGNRMYLTAGGAEMSGSHRQLELSVWRLTGPAATWGRQLEAHLRRDPVFMLIGGLAAGGWQPIHAFCEKAQLPCLLPLTDLPVVSERDWYTLYFSKGYYQEGQAVARHLRSLPEPVAPEDILQVVAATPEAEALAAGFRETWAELGGAPVPERRLRPGADPRAALDPAPSGTLLLWTGPGAPGILQALPHRPARVFLSGRQLGEAWKTLPESLRAGTFLTWPYRDPAEEPAYSKFADTLLAGLAERHPETRISSRTYALLQIFRLGLMEMDRNLYRDTFMDRVSMFRDQFLPDYPRLSFGPGQRYAAKGCYLAQVGPGAEPALVRRSAWVVH